MVEGKGRKEQKYFHYFALHVFMNTHEFSHIHRNINISHCCTAQAPLKLSSVQKSSDDAWCPHCVFRKEVSYAREGLHNTEDPLEEILPSTGRWHPKRCQPSQRPPVWQLKDSQWAIPVMLHLERIWKQGAKKWGIDLDCTILHPCKPRANVCVIPLVFW